ncbi:MAG: UDP-N-acetylmuramoyl-L-alanine--D-glutamate ligase, partial [Deltaproteobacteria bacterium HGW-Deltaproteobacteria-20]
MNLAGKQIIVVGLGRSGVDAADLCLSRGARVTATDRLARSAVSADVLALEGKGARLVLGGHEGVLWGEADMVVVSPGVPVFAGLLEAERAGVEVIGELELACRFVRAPLGVIGGTNGKSTVTTWLGQMIGDLGKVFVGGNLGTPLASHVHEPWDRVILEISSFQAERVPTLHPRAAALLNITDDHLDRYDGFDAYADAKGNVFVNMGPEDVAVVPAGDAVCAKQASRGRARVLTFGPGGDVRPEGDAIVDSVRGWRFPLSSIPLPGEHNVLNACASIAMAGALGGNAEQVGRALSSFEGLHHRMQLVAEIDGVSFYDDSKGTNVGASVAALRGLRQPRAVLIAGGRDKQGSYGPLVEALRERGRALVVIGEA